jgi:hypothetical protein
MHMRGIYDIQSPCEESQKIYIEQWIHNDWIQIIVCDNNYDNLKFLLILGGFVGKYCPHVMDL